MLSAEKASDVLRLFLMFFMLFTLNLLFVSCAVDSNWKNEETGEKTKSEPVTKKQEVKKEIKPEKIDATLSLSEGISYPKTLTILNVSEPHLQFTVESIISNQYRILTVYVFRTEKTEGFLSFLDKKYYITVFFENGTLMDWGDYDYITKTSGRLNQETRKLIDQEFTRLKAYKYPY